MFVEHAITLQLSHKRLKVNSRALFKLKDEYVLAQRKNSIYLLDILITALFFVERKRTLIPSGLADIFIANNSVS